MAASAMRRGARWWGAFWAACILALSCAPCRAEETRVLCDFEGPESLRLWEVNAGTAAFVAEGVTQGQRALQITFDPAGPYHPAYINSYRLSRDWSQFDALVLDVTNPNPQPIPGYVLVGDAAWQQKGSSYWNRHNASRTLAPGRTEWIIPLRGMYRGEAGSRNNDIKRDIDPDSIVRLDFGFGARGTSGRVIIDGLRLVKAARPAGVWAFDFGPPSQAVMLGWTGVSHETRYAGAQGFGWGPRGGAPWDGADRDTTFGPPLLRDFCEAGGYEFHMDAPPGRYSVLVIYENCGYWGGEQAMQRTRRILADGREAWREERPDGQAHVLYRFEDVEPVGADLWDAYMAEEIARPVAFDVQVAQGGLTLRFEADRAWGSKLSALALHRTGDAAATGWLREQLDLVADEFRRTAVCLDAPAAPLAVPPAWRERGLVAWPVGIEETITPNSTPPASLAPPDGVAASGLAVRGEYEPLCVAVRPLRDLGACTVELEPLAGPSELAGEASIVRYGTSRGFNSIAYRVAPHTLRPAGTVDLAKDVTREIIVTVRTDRASPAGKYAGALKVLSAGGETLLRVPLRLSVRPVILRRDTEFLMGFFGLMPPSSVPDERRWDLLAQTLTMLREHGMNAVSGGPNWQLAGWQKGEPVIDFGEMDRFFGLLREHGFARLLNGYGGVRFVGLHERWGYEKGRVGAEVERQSGLPYEDALMRCWRAVDAHARPQGWPTIFYAMCDETRVRDKAERELEFMGMMAKVSRTFPKTVRTSGSYSVNFAARPQDRDDLAYWHQRFFEALYISSLNGHDETVMAEARKLGKGIHIYNQGRSRYSFGLYQWSEFRKGVRARWQWHLSSLHGYQFFDLDGREPDTAMICYGRDRIYPTIHFERCREGAEDFYLYQTLWDLVERARAEGRQTAAVAAAADLLEGLTAQVKLNQREAPEGFDAGAVKARVVAAMEAVAGEWPGLQ